VSEREFLPQPYDPDAPLFTVTVAARLADMHPQTLRGYDRLGLVVPTRTKGRGRRYTLRDVQRLRHVQQLSVEGINLEGIRCILALEQHVEQLQEQTVRLMKLLRRTEEPAASRTFTAGTTGFVHLGRGDVRLRALTTGQ
jgi:MerR family transcriptional regulator/heat shock protein HspR